MDDRPRAPGRYSYAFIAWIDKLISRFRDPHASNRQPRSDDEASVTQPSGAELSAADLRRLAEELLRRDVDVHGFFTHRRRIGRLPERTPPGTLKHILMSPAGCPRCGPRYHSDEEHERHADPCPGCGRSASIQCFESQRTTLAAEGLATREMFDDFASRLPDSGDFLLVPPPPARFPYGFMSRFLQDSWDYNNVYGGHYMNATGPLIDVAGHETMPLMLVRRTTHRARDKSPSDVRRVATADGTHLCTLWEGYVYVLLHRRNYCLHTGYCFPGTIYSDRSTSRVFLPAIVPDGSSHDPSLQSFVETLTLSDTHCIVLSYVHVERS